MIMLMPSQLLILDLKSELHAAVFEPVQTAVADVLRVTGIPAIFTNEWSFHK